MSNKISISGCSGIGKTTFCKRIKKFCLKFGMDIAHVEIDNWILDREARAKAGIYHGYNLSGFYVDKMFTDLDTLIIGRAEIKVFPYDHSIGEMTTKPLIIRPADIILLDGAISLMDVFIERYKVQGLFFDATPTLARKLKHYLNITERGYDKAQALRDAIVHEAGYRDFCRPQIKNADRVIELTGFRNGREYKIRHAPGMADQIIRPPFAPFCGLFGSLIKLSA